MEWVWPQLQHLDPSVPISLYRFSIFHRISKRQHILCENHEVEKVRKSAQNATFYSGFHSSLLEF